MHVLILQNIYNTPIKFVENLLSKLQVAVQKDGVRGKYVSLMVIRSNYSSVKKLPRFCDTQLFIISFKSA